MKDKFSPTEQDDETVISKSAVKREMAMLQEMGRSLLQLPESKLATMPLSEELTDALALARRLKQREALRRQLQLIGKLMRREDRAQIASALEQLAQADQKAKEHFHHLEKLRDQLISEGDKAVELLLGDYPLLDRQHLRQLVRQARDDKNQNRQVADCRKLFRYLRENIDS